MNARPEGIAAVPSVAAGQPERPRPAKAPALEFRLLGPFEVRRSGAVISLGGPRQRALLALLCLHRGVVVAVDRIVDELWGESPPPTARHMVEVYVSKLRKLLDADLLATRAPGYVLLVGPEQLDVARFERLLAEGRDTLAAGDPALAASRLADALALWRGPPLTDFAYEPFAQAEIARLEERRLLAQEARIEAELDLGKGVELVAELEDLIAVAPFRERLRAQLMLALYRAGRQADALAAYRAARETLVEELGVEPSRELRELERAILAQEDRLVSPRRPGAPAAPETRRVATILFVEPAGEGPHLDPEALQPALERSLERTEAVLARHGASVERAPDGTIMAVFGNPVAHEDDAVRGVHAAAELRELRVLSRAAVDTGEVLAGGEPAVRGPVVRATAQLLATASSGDVLAGELTRRLAAHSAQFETVEAEGRSVCRLVGVTQGAPARPVLLDVPVVGRTEELAELGAVLSQTVDDRRPALVTLVGDPGIGKSRLAAEFTLAAQNEARVLTGRCLAYGEGITYWPLREVIGELAPKGSVAELEALLAGLADGKRIVRRLAATLGLVDEIYPVEEIRWAARRLFETLAQRRPLVLLLEDVQWAEQTFLDLLRHVVETGADAPLLVLCLARPELLEEHPGWEIGDERSTILTLEALSPSETVELISRLDPAETLSKKERERVLEAADGNPLFVEQLVAFAAETRGQTDIPPTLKALLAARLDLLGPGERTALAWAAVVGREFSAEAVTELLPPGARPRALRHLETLERRKLIEPERATRPFENTFRFGHVLIQEAAYRSLPKERRADLHERLADWLERTPVALSGEQDEMVGYHLEQAYRYRAELGPVGDEERRLASRAGNTLSEVGLKAFRRGDAAGAASLLTRGLHLLPEDAPARGELTLALGDSLAAVGDWRAASAVYEHALAAARALGDQGLALEATLQRNWSKTAVSPVKRSFEQSLLEAEQAAAELEELGHARGLARAWQGIAMFRKWMGQGAAAAAAAEQAAAFAHEAGDRHFERSSLAWLGMALYTGPTPAREGIRRCNEILARTDDTGLRSSMHRYLNGFHAMLGHAEEARRQHELALADAEELGLKPRVAGVEMLFLAFSETLEPEEAERRQRRSLVLLKEMGYESMRSTAAAKLARTLCAQGRYDEAERYASIGESTAAPDDFDSHTFARAARANVLAHRGDLEPAESLARDAVAIADGTDDLDSRAWFRTDLAEVLALAEKTSEACSVLEEAIRLAEAKEEVVLAERARARLTELQAPAPPRRS